MSFTEICSKAMLRVGKAKCETWILHALKVHCWSVGLSSHGFWPLGMRFWVWKIRVESAQKCRWWWTHNFVPNSPSLSSSNKIFRSRWELELLIHIISSIESRSTLKNQFVLMKWFRKCFAQILWSGICQVDSIFTLLESILIISVRIFESTKNWSLFD